MTDAVKRMLMGLARDEYMELVEKRKAAERELEAEVERRKNDRKREDTEQHSDHSKVSDES